VWLLWFSVTKPEAEFVDLMANLNLPYPRKIDASLPANLKDGMNL
jgi:sulfur dioxygenase